MTIDLSSLGWDDAFAADFDRLTGRDRCAIGTLRPGRVSHADRGVCTVLAADGPRRVSLAGGLLSHAATDPGRLPCPGDWVAVRDWPDGRPTVDAVLSRRSTVDDEERTIVANVDVVAVVEPLRPAPDLGRIGRLLDTAGGSGARPMIILTGGGAGRHLQRVTCKYPGIEVLTSKPVIAYGQTIAFLGSVGCGASHLVEGLVGAAVMSRRGRRREPRGLVLLPEGGAVFDASDDWLFGSLDRVLSGPEIVIPRG
jgi:ribosome biogenesis GTPase